MGLLSNLAKGFGNFVGGVARGVGNVAGGVAQGVGSVVGGVVSGVGTALGLNSPEKQKQDLQRLQNMSPEKRQELANAAQQLLQTDPNNQLGQTILNALNQTATPTNTSNAPPNIQNMRLAQLIDLLKKQQEGNEPTKLQGPRVVVQESSQPETIGYFKAATAPSKRPTAVTPRTYEPTPRPKPTPRPQPVVVKPAPNPLIPKELPGKVIGKPPSPGPVKPPAEIATKPKKPTQAVKTKSTRLRRTTIVPKKPTPRKSTGFLTGIRNFISRLFRR